MKGPLLKINICFVLSIVLLTAYPACSHARENGDLILATRILGIDVFDAKRNLIGEVEDIIVSRGGGIRRFAVEFGGMLDIGDKLVALSPRAFEMTDDGMMIDATEEQLEGLPELDYYAAGLSPEYYYRTTPYAGSYDYPPPDYYYSEPYQWAYSPARFLASVLIHRALSNERGMKLGVVKDLVIDRKNNRIEKIVISPAGAAGEDVYVALPYKPLGFLTSGILYDIDPENLKNYAVPYGTGSGR